MQELERVAIVESLEPVAEPQLVAQVLRPCRQDLRRQWRHGPQELFHFGEVLNGDVVKEKEHLAVEVGQYRKHLGCLVLARGQLFQVLCHPPAEHTSGSRWVGATFLDHHAARIAGGETPHQFVGQHGLPHAADVLDGNELTCGRRTRLVVDEVLERMKVFLSPHELVLEAAGMVGEFLTPLRHAVADGIEQAPEARVRVLGEADHARGRETLWQEPLLHECLLRLEEAGNNTQ
jgi:hypothetical protein